MTFPALPPSLVHTLPLETFIHILDFCSPATLAMCCRVSHEWLELASEPLWRTVCLSRPEQLELLFRSVSAAEQATLPRLPASLAPHLSLKRIRHLTITSSTVLRTQLPLRAQPATKALRPARMVLDNLFGLCSPVQGLFSVVRPKELVFLLPRDDFAAFASLSLSAVRSPRLRARSRNVVVVVGQLSQKLNSPVNQHYPPSSPDEIHTLFFGPDVAVGGLNGVYPEHKISLRFVLLPSACKDHVKLKAFLAVRHKGGALHPGWFNSRPGSYVVEVPFEEAKLWVETGLAAIPVESRKLVVVQVQPPGSWGEGLAWAGGVRLKRE